MDLQVSIVVLLNDMQLSFGTTRRILAVICEELQLGAVEFVEDALF